MNESSLIFFIQGSQQALQLAELLLVVLEGLVIGFANVVKSADHLFEVLRLSVHVLEDFWVDVLFVVELSDLLLHVLIEHGVPKVVHSGDLFEERKEVLAWARTRGLLSLGEIEWEGKHLLLVRWVHV